MKKVTIRAAALAAALAATVPAAAFSQSPFKQKGTLIDQMCGASSSQADADTHTRDCALMEHCLASGYGVVVDGKFHKFDAAGSKQAEAILRSTKKADHITATVEGVEQKDGSIAVTKITEE